MVEQHQNIVNFREQQIKDDAADSPRENLDSQEEDLLTTTETSSEELTIEEESKGHNEYEEKLVEEESEHLTDLQRDVLDNLELISELVKQVHQLDILFADRNKGRLDNNFLDDYNDRGEIETKD